MRRNIFWKLRAFHGCVAARWIISLPSHYLVARIRIGPLWIVTCPWQTPKASRHVAAWGNFTRNDPRVSEIDYSLQAGLLGAGIIPERQDDKIAVGIDYAHISSQADTPKSYEMATERFYECYLGRGITVQPDLQYFNKTGGGAYPDALIELIRITVNF